MKKLVISLLVFGLTSSAGATTLSWDVGSTYEFDYTVGGTVNIASDDANPYTAAWGSYEGDLISDIIVLPAAGLDGGASFADGSFSVWTLGETPAPGIASGNQFEVHLAATSAMNGNSYDIVLDYYGIVGGPTTLTVTIIPEPGTLVLLGLGGLLLFRRRRGSLKP
jgi:hypothetical protein